MERTVDLENICHIHFRNFSQYSQRMATLWLDIPVYLINFVCRVQSLSVMGGEKRVELCRDTRPITSVIRDHNIRWRLHCTTRTSKKVWLAKQQLWTCKELFGTFLCRHCTTSTWNYLISRFMEDVKNRPRNFLSFSITQLLNYLISRFMEDVKYRPRNFLSFSIWFRILFLGSQLQESSPTCDKASELK